MDNPNYNMEENKKTNTPEKKQKVIKRAPLYKRLIARFKKYIMEDSNTSFKFIKEFIFYVIVYGILINYMLTGIFGLSFNIFYFPSYGILFYLIKEELPHICAKLIPNRRQ